VKLIDAPWSSVTLVAVLAAGVIAIVVTIRRELVRPASVRA
jgi:hypothetical protein